MSASGATGPDAALTTCDREPIHVPGAIQPHGVLFALREPDLSIVQVSANVAAFTGMAPAEILGRPLEALFDERSMQLVRGALAGREAHDQNPLPVAMGGRAYDGILHRHRGATLLELEPQDADDTGPPTLTLRAALAHMAAAISLRDLLDTAAGDVRRITGYDRVLVYRFDADAHGEVVAEDRRADLEPYLGLHYPASDIPQPARALYLVSSLRIIPDRVHEPAPILPPERPDTGEPLDLTFSVLRSVSPVHLEYMRNIGFRASMSISLVRGGALWGLISCSHGAPRHVPYAIRGECEIIARYLSSQIAAKERLEALQAIDRRRGTLAQLNDFMRAECDVERGLLRRSPNLLDLVEAGGAAVHARGVSVTIGQTPRPDQIGLLVAWLRGAVQEEVFATDALPRSCSFAESFHDVGSGLLAFSLPKPDPEYVLWFRPEVLQTVRWGGDPTKPVEPGPPGGTLSPRRSFALWKEIVRGRSLAWSPADVEVAAALRRAATEMDLARQVEREQAARVAAEAAQLRFHFLREASSQLAGSLDYEATLGSVARLATDRFADLCVIDLIGEAGSLRRVQVHHASPAKQPTADALYDHAPDRGEGSDRALFAGGRATLRARLDPAWLREHLARDEALLDLLSHQLRVRSLIVSPLVARGRVLGEIYFFTAESGHVYDSADLALAEELARRAAVAIENAALYRRAQEALDEARKATRARDELIAVVSHDLASPLTALLASAVVLSQAAGASGDVDARIVSAGERILRSARRMEALLRDLRDMDRLRARRFAVSLEPEAIGALVEDAVDDARLLAEAKGITLHRAEIAPDVRVNADRDRVLQVLGNLLGNALRFTPDGGRIDVDVRPQPAEVCVAVHDSGPGIAPEHLRHIFDRGWHTTEAAGGGTGLGLYIAKGIVEAHGGRLWAESRDGAGSTFSFTLPRA